MLKNNKINKKILFLEAKAFAVSKATRQVVGVWKSIQILTVVLTFGLLHVIYPSSVSGTTVSMGLSYGRVTVVSSQPGGKGGQTLRNGLAVADLPATSIALVLVDTWNTSDPRESDKLPNGTKLNQIMLLDAARAAGMTVIHAPNRPVVDKYPQYHELRTKVEDLLTSRSHEFMVWPMWAMPFQTELDTSVSEARQVELTEAEYSRLKQAWPNRLKQKGLLSARDLLRSDLDRTPIPPFSAEPDISRYKTPIPGEFVVRSYEEFRYVLWQRKTVVIMYVGGSLNECIMQRPTGLNALVGTDERRLPFTIVLVEDCVESMSGVSTTAAQQQLALLDYVRMKIAYTTRLDRIRFDIPKPVANRSNP